LVLEKLKLRATVAAVLVLAFTSTEAFAQNSSGSNPPASRTAIIFEQPLSEQPLREPAPRGQEQSQAAYVRPYSLATAKDAFDVHGVAEPTLPQPSPEGIADVTQAASTPSRGNESSGHGLIVRSVSRTLQDQKELYTAPFKRQNLKWDVLFLAGTAALIATDRQSARAISDGNVNTFRNISNASISGLSVALGGIFVVGLTGDHPHAHETGMLGLEALVNTFVIYAPMQFIFGRERPTEGTGNGRFFVNRGFNTSFPGGHGMFAMSMATIIAHEYRKPWVEVLAYGAAAAVAAGRIGAKMHFNSDILVGSSLGFLISRHIFYAHCDPELSDGCHR
jgi:membrane-associated phospholipid phosphatase